MDNLSLIEPEYTPSQREELARIIFLMSELSSLRDRGLIGEEAIVAVEAEKSLRREEVVRLGTFTGAMRKARSFALNRPREALALAETARELAPEQMDSWMFSAELLARLGRHDEAIALVRRAVENHGHEAMRPLLANLQADAGRRNLAQVVDAALARARAAIVAREFEAALTASREVIAREPSHADAIVIAIRSLLALDRLDEASSDCSVLYKLRRNEAAIWAARIGDQRVRGKPSANEPTGIKPPENEVIFLEAGDFAGSAPALPKFAPVAVPSPKARWSAIASEFLEDHWQKLFLALAVLLTAVGSTVGAAVLLGERLRMPEAKCLLATAYTVMFAALGRAMARWGAVRVGRIMRLTTLIVLPVSFALVGELPALGRSSSVMSMAVLAIDSVAMMVLVWMVCRSLGMSGGRITPLALMALGMVNALTTRSIAMPMGLMLLIAASCVYAASAEWLGWWLGRNRAPDKSAESDAPYFAFGLLTFFFACAVGRIGGYLLGLPPTLFALPTMLAAASAVRVADGLRAAGREGRPVAMLRLAGYSTSALAFALALAKPFGVNPLYSGNTVAAAMVGLALYARALARERKPAYLYAAFAALFLAYFGVHAFIKDLLVAVEGSIGHFLGYGRKLPFAFRALNGLTFNTVLAALSIVLTRRWNDPRLARHCHYIGVPLAIAACVLSGFEPLAAVLVMGGYAIGLAVATWVFANPALEYLACLALTGAAVAASTYLGDLAAGARSLAIAAVGLVLWVACRILAMLRVPPAYRDPIVHSARVVATLALLVVAWAAWPSGTPSWTTIAALWVLCGLYILIGRESPRTSLAYAAVSCSAVAAILTIQLVTARAGRPIDAVWLAAWSAGVALLYELLSPWLAHVADRRGEDIGPTSRAKPYPLPLIHLGLILEGFASATLGRFLVDHYAVLSTIHLAGIAVTMVITSIGLLIASTRLRGEPAVPYASVLTAACGAVAAALAVASWRGIAPSPTGLALACGGVGLILSGLGDRIRGRSVGVLSGYRDPLLIGTFLAILCAWGFGGLEWTHTRELTATLALTALALTVAIRQRPVRPLSDVALMTGLAAWLVGWGALRSLEISALPRDGLLVLAYAIASLAATECLRFFSGRGGRGVLAPTLSRSLPEFAGVAALAGLGMSAAVFWKEDYRHLTLDLALAALIFLWLPRFRRDLGMLHLGLTLTSLATLPATRWAIGPRATAFVLGALALTAAIDGLILVSLRWIGRKRGLSEFFLNPLRDLGIVLAAVPFALALAASVESLDSYPLAISALLMIVVPMIASAVLDRSSWRTYAAIVTGVAAAYLTMFELGRDHAGHVSSLGVLASLLALTCWVIERATDRFVNEDWKPIFRLPARDAAIVLALLAILPEWNSPRALLLASVPFLLLIKSLPRPEWLYPALGLMLASAGFAILPRWGESGLMTAAVVTGFAAWGLGWVFWRYAPSICRTLRLPEGRGYELPPYHAAMALGVAALGLGLNRSIMPGLSLPTLAWVPASVGVLALLMLKPYPGRGWVDGFVGLMSLAALALLAPQLMHPMTCGLVLLTLSLIWRMAEWGALPTQDVVCRRLGLGFNAVGEVLGQWALGLLVIGSLPLVLRIAPSVAAATFGLADSLPETTHLEWWTGLVAILLFGANLDLARRAVKFNVAIGLHATTTALLWWLSVPASPLIARFHLDPAIVLPLITVAQAVVSAAIGIRSKSLVIAHFAGGLSLVAVALTAFRPSMATTATFFLASAVQGVLSVSLKRREMAGLGSALVMTGLFFGAWNVANTYGWENSTRFATVFAIGQTLGAIGLISAGRADRRRAFGMAAIVEGFGLVGLLLAALAVVAPTIYEFGSVGSTQALANVGVMFAVGSMCAVMASRLGSIPLAFASQAAILLGYAAFRSGFPLPRGGDSTAMLLLSGIDLGIAEIAGRGRRRLFALPAMATGLILPLVSVGLALWHGVIGEESLVVLFAAGTFYAATCARMRWKSAGYAAAVLYNAALWVLWSLFGWHLASDPQFFLVPVGFSTILFAEANRRELGRNGVNAVRGAGLSLIYLALAVPIWQTASFAAWAAILGVSLIGIFAGIALRSQAFLWLGLSGFVLDVVYQLGKIGMDHAAAKWAIMLGLGLTLFGFVALNEKKKLMATLRKYVEVVRAWE